MPKRYIFYLVGLLLLAGLGYYGFSKWTEAREKVDLWTLVPEDAVFVVESGNHENMINRLKRTQVWESLSEVVYLRRLQDNLTMLDSLGDNREPLSKFLDNKRILTSVHVTGQSDFDLVFYIPISTVKEHRYMRTLVENLEKHGQFEHISRKYQGTTISEFRKQSGQRISHFTYRNNLILSSSPVLLDGIVRKIKRKQFVSVADGFGNTDYLNQENVYANVFINFQNLPPFLNLFVKPELQPDLEYLCSLNQSSMLELKLENNKIFLNGFSNPETVNQTLARHLAGQKPEPLEMQQVLPNNVAFLMHFGLDQATQLRQYKGPKPVILQPEVQLMADSIALQFRGELGLAYLQTSKISASPGKVIFAKSTDAPKTVELLNQLMREVNTQAKTVPYRELKGKFEIRMLPVKDFPQHVFGKLFSGFAQSYYVAVPPYVIFGASPAALRSVLNDIQGDNVWGKSVAQKAFLEEAQHEANVSFFLNSVNAWHLLNRYVNPEKREGLLRNESLIKDFNQFSLQFRQVDKQYYTSLLFRQKDALAVEDLNPDTLEIEKSVSFKSKLTAGPFSGYNPASRNMEMLVQDSAFVLHNVNPEGRINWSDSLSEPVRGEILQAPFGADNQPKYLFATSHRIHCLDRKGQETDNFPFYLPDSVRLQRLTLLQLKNVRGRQLLVDDEMGNLFMFRDNGSLMPGWGPRRLDHKLAAAPQLLTIGSRNVIVTALENGLIYALDEDGETLPGFPFSVRQTLRSGFFSKPGVNLRKTELILVTQRGEVITFNLAGEILKRHQLLRPDRDATFELIPESNGQRYLIARQSLGRVTLLSSEFKLLLERNFFTSSRKIVQYYHFAADNVVYAITETGPQKTYLFDLRAQPIGNHQISNRNQVKLFYNTVAREYNLYLISGNALKKLTIARER